MKFLRRPSKNRLARRLATAASFAALLLASPLTGLATVRSYVGGNNGLWTSVTNWNPIGEPGSGDDVVLGTQSASTTDLHVIYNRVYTYNPPYTPYSLSSVTLNSSGLSGYMIVDQNVAGSTLASDSVNIGQTVGFNTWNLSNGNFFTLSLVMGQTANSRNNFFNVSGNSTVSIGGAIGRAGSGTLNQSGGAITLTGDLTLGQYTGGSGTYNLSGGQIKTLNNPTLSVGGYGTALFTMSGGSADLSELDVNSYGGASATFNMTGGSLNVASLVVGDIKLGTGGTTSSGTMNVSGGTVSGDLTVEVGGTFNLKTGGVFDPSPYSSGGTEFFIRDGGLFSYLGGTLKDSTYETQMEGSGEFRLNGYSVTLGGLTGSGIVRSNAPGNATLTLHVPLDRDFVFAGTISNGTSGVVSLTVTGDNPYNYANGHGSQTLSGANTYTGATTVTDFGTLKAGSNSALPVHTNLTISNSGTFDTNGFTTTVDALYGSGGTLKVDGAGVFNTGSNNAPTTFAGKFAGNGTINKLGTGQMSLDVGASTFNGTVNLQSGYIVSAAANSLPPLATFNISDSTVLTAAGDQTVGALAGSAGALVSLQNTPTLSVGNNNTDSTYLGKITPDGTVQKIGTGTFTLGGGANDTASVSTGTGGPAFTVAGGTLMLNKALGTNAISGPLTLTGGTVSLARGQQIADSSPLTINGGTFKLNGNGEIVGKFTGSGGTLDLGGGTLTVNETGTADIYVDTALTGGGTFVKNGGQQFFLTNTANSGGTFISNSGFLFLKGVSSITGASANNNASMNFVFSTANLNGGNITANAGSYVQYFGSTINNAYLRGLGSQVVIANGYPASTFNNVTSYNSATLTLTGEATLNNFTNGGTLNVNNSTLYSGGLNTITGIMNVKSDLITTDFGSSGVMTINNGGALLNTNSNLVLGGGSRTTINSGGLLSTVSGTSIELNGALLVNNGTQQGKLNVNYGSTAKGSGTFGAVNVTDGGRFGVNASSAGVTPSVVSMSVIELASPKGLAATAFVGPQYTATPAANNVASLTLGSGSVFAFNLQNAAGAAGTGYDLVHSAGALTLAAGTTVGNQITISVFSLAADGSSGPAANFNPAQSYQFTLVQADGGVTGFLPGEFAVDASGFKNSLNGGTFSVLQSGNNLVLAYNAVPEPGTWATFGLGGAVLGLVVFRRRING